MANSNREFIFPEILTSWKFKDLRIEINKVNTVKVQEGLELFSVMGQNN